MILCRTGEIRDEDWDAGFYSQLWRLVLDPASWSEGRAQRLGQVVSTILAAPEVIPELMFAEVDCSAAGFLLTMAGFDGSAATTLLKMVYLHRPDLRPSIRARLGEVRWSLSLCCSC